MNNRAIRNLGTYTFMIAALGVFLYGFPFQNIWTLITGLVLWLLAVANARITELECKEDLDKTEG